MSKIKKSFLFLGTILFLLALLIMPGVYSAAGPLIIGGVITGGILGGFSGKVGAVVGGKWKNTDYMRGYVIPANPKSEGQQDQRGKIGRLVMIGKSILTSIIHVYWNPFYSSMSGYNAFVKANKASLSDATFDINGQVESTSFAMDADFKLSVGTLAPLVGLASVYTTGTGGLAITWTDNSGAGNALATDAVVLAAFLVDGTFLDMDDSDARDDEAGTLTLPTGLTATDIICLGFAKRGTGSSFVVSNSLGDVAAAA